MIRLLLTLIIVAAAMGTPRLVLALDADRDQDHQAITPSEKDDGGSPKNNEKQEQKLAKEFNVDESLIRRLREQNLGYGEIRHVLTIAHQMPGGINAENTKKIMDMRQGGEHKEGWGRIAQDLDVKLNSKNEKNGNTEIHKSEHAESHGMSNTSAGMSHSTGSSMKGGMGHGHKGK